ncbi:MAG TPA: hypothetical protein VFU93_07020 [Acidimicrobiales bacterium]|nr:hypothetical protein [Acidimicrobiales bacterium]
MSRSPKLQRLTSMAVPALLAANAMVLVLGLAGMTDDAPAGAETVTYIKAADGSMIAVDPNTPEGWKAIADAEQRGEQVVTVDEQDAPAELMQQQSPSTPGGLLKPVDDLLDDTESTVVRTVDELGNTVDSVVDQVTDIVDDTAGTNVGDTVDPIVDDTTDTLTTTVSTVVRETRNTATTVVQPAEDVVEDTVNEVVPSVGGTSSNPTPTVAPTVPTTLPGL